jgi:transposase
MKNPDQFIYIGMDIHKETHAACVTDCFSQVVWEKQISNDESGFKSLVARVNKLSLSSGKEPIFGLEDTYGNGLLLANFLARSGFKIKTVNPVLVDRDRRKTTHPEKSDLLDAKGVARVLIHEGIDTLPDYNLSQITQIAKELRELNNDREYLVKEQTRLKNQLHALIHLVWGNAYKEIHKNFFTKGSLNFLISNPLPKETSNIPFSLEITRSRIKRKTQRLLDIKEEIKMIEKELKTLVLKTDQKLESLNGCGLVLAAQILAEAKDISRFPNAGSLAKYAGIAPREKSSGKSFHHQKTKSGNRRLNTAIHHIGLSQIGRRGNDYAKTYFQKKIGEGKTKKQALACLKRKLVNIVYAMLKNKSVYSYRQEPLLT